jgi:hypothetical protein
MEVPARDYQRGKVASILVGQQKKSIPLIAAPGDRQSLASPLRSGDIGDSVLTMVLLDLARQAERRAMLCAWFALN